MDRPLPDESLRPALTALSAVDEDLARVYETCGLPPRRRSEPGFAGLVRMIAGQQVSTASAAAMIARLEAACGALTAANFLALPAETLATIGFSRAKLRYSTALAEADLAGTLDSQALAGLPDEEVLRQLTALPGIGRWTAEIYLLFALQRPDIWPAGDLAVVTALGRAKGLSHRPSEKEAREMAEAWRPHRSAAARLLWHFYRHDGVALGRGERT